VEGGGGALSRQRGDRVKATKIGRKRLQAQARLAEIQETKKRHKFFRELRNICRGILVYTGKTTRGVGD
jgi:hypothetical protein